jgi:hypothetical protein
MSKETETVFSGYPTGTTDEHGNQVYRDHIGDNPTQQDLDYTHPSILTIWVPVEGVVNQDVVLINVLAEIQRNKNAFAILAENKRVDIAIVAIADNPLKIRTIYFAQYLAIYFA